RKALEAARKAGGATKAVAAAELVQELARADGLELPVDGDELVRLAEEADRAASSRGTRASLISALLVRAGRGLAGQDKGYAALSAKTRRALGHGYLLALVLSGEVGPREAALKNADVRRALDLERQEVKAFPDEAGPWAWALLRGPHPEEAAAIARAARADEAGRLLHVLGQ